MDELLQTTLNDPLVGKVATAVMGMIVINVLVPFLQGLTSSPVESSNMRYGIPCHCSNGWKGLDEFSDVSFV